MRQLVFLAALGGIFAAHPALAGCPDAETIQRYVEDWQAKRPTKALPVANLEEATCARDKLVQALGASTGVITHACGMS
jgi:hypothetical protein